MAALHAGGLVGLVLVVTARVGVADGGGGGSPVDRDGPVDHRRVPPACSPTAATGRRPRCGGCSWCSARRRSRTRRWPGAPTTATTTPTPTVPAIRTRSPGASGGPAWGGCSAPGRARRRPTQRLVDLARYRSVGAAAPLVRRTGCRRGPRRAGGRVLLVGRPVGRPVRGGQRSGPSSCCRRRSASTRWPTSSAGAPTTGPRRPRQHDDGADHLRRGVPQLPPPVPGRLPQRGAVVALRPWQVADLGLRAGPPGQRGAPHRPHRHRRRPRRPRT